MFIWGGGKPTPRKLDMFSGSRAAAQLSMKKHHYAVITVEKELYTWTVRIVQFFLDLHTEFVVLVYRLSLTEV